VVKSSRDDNHNATSLDTSNYKVVEPGDLVVNKMKAWQGSMGISPYKGIVSPAYITCKKKIAETHDGFVHQLLRSSTYIWEYNRLSYGIRVGQWDMHFEDFKKVPILLPPPSEQTAIANYLDNKCAKIDRAIAQKERLIELLQERKQIIIQEAVTGKTVWSEKEQAFVPLSESGVGVKESGVEWIGEVPAHWEVKKIFHVAKIDTGATPDRSKEAYWGGEIPWVKTGEVNYETIVKTEEHITTAGLKNSATRLAPAGTLLMAMYGQGVTRGRVSLLGIDAAYNQACCAMIFKNEVFNKFAFYFFVMAYSFIRDAGNESSQMNISSGYISSLKLLVPPISEQKRVVQFIDEQELKIFEAITLQQTQIEKLKEYKATLIDSVVRGKVKVV
jgi:type I restriction enzyme S subunit